MFAYFSNDVRGIRIFCSGTRLCRFHFDVSILAVTSLPPYFFKLSLTQTAAMSVTCHSLRGPKVPFTTPLLLLLAVAALAVAAMNPLLLGGDADPCIPADTPLAEVCFPTRCNHLFNVSRDGRLIPTPARFPQRYSAFRCNATTFREYGGVAGRTCLRPVCACRKYYSGGSCFPARLNGCATHKCVYNTRTVNP